MATVTVYFLNTAATSPNWFGRVQDGGSAPAGALSAFGWTVGKTAITTAFWRGRIGATGPATVAQAASYVGAATGPAQGTGAGATTAGNSFRSDNPLRGTFAAGNWNFTFGMRTGTATTVGRIRLNVWASANADGTSARKLTSAVLVGTTVTMATTTTTYNSTVTWAAPQVVLNGEYLFTQIEWEETTAGTANQCNVLFYQASFVTTDYIYTVAVANAAAGNPVLGAPLFAQQNILGTSAPTIAGAPVFSAPTLTKINVLPNGGAAVAGAPVLSAPALKQVHMLEALALVVEPPTLDAATATEISSAVPDALDATSLEATAPSLGTPALQPISLLVASNLATAPPVEASAAFGQAQKFTALAFAPSPPTIAIPAFNKKVAAVAVPLSAGLPTISAAVLGQRYALAATPPAVGAGPPAGASVYINFLTNKSYVGAGEVAVTSLVGHDARVVSGGTNYHPDTVTPLGYDPYPVYGDGIAFLGPLMDAVLAGGSVVLKFQSRGGIVEDYSAYDGFTFQFHSVGNLGAYSSCYNGGVFPPSLDGYVEFDTQNTNLYQDNTWKYSLTPGQINVIAFTFVTLGHFDVAANDIWSDTGPVTAADNPAAHPFVACNFQIYTPLVSIAVYDTLTLADLQAKTAPVLDAGGVVDVVAVSAGAPLIGVSVLGQAGVMAAIPAAAGAPIIAAGAFAQAHLIAAINPAINPPAFSTTSIAQKHLIAAIIPAFNSPTIGQPVLGQRHEIGTVSAQSGAPAFGPAVMGQAGVMAAIPAAAGAPILGQPAFGQKHVATALALVTSAPAMGSSSLGKVLSATALAVGGPALGSSSLAKPLTAAPLVAGIPALEASSLTAVVSLAAAKLDVAAPVIATPAWEQVQKLVPQILTIGPPSLPTLTIGQSGVMGCIPLVAGAPVLGAPIIGQRHVLPAAVGASTGVPNFTGVTFGRKVTLVAISPQAGAPAFGQTVLRQQHDLDAVPAASGVLVYSPVMLGQAGVMAAVPLWLQGPSLPVLAPIQRHKLTPLFLGIGAPVLGVSALVGSTKLPRPQSTFAGRFKPLPAVLGQAHALTAQAASAGAPVVPLATFFEGETFPAVSLAVSAPVLGAPALAPVYRLATPGHINHGPVLGQPALGQRHGIGTVSARAGRPQFARPRLALPPIALADPIPIVAGAPDLGAPILRPLRARPASAVDVTGRPRLSVISGQNTGATVSVNTQRVTQLTGQRSGKTSITGRKQRTAI